MTACATWKRFSDRLCRQLDTGAQPEMRERAIASGCVDFILSLEAIAATIVSLTKRLPRAPER